MRLRPRFLVLLAETRAGIQPPTVHPHAVAVRRQRAACQPLRRFHVPHIPDRHALTAPLAGEEQSVAVSHRLRFHGLHLLAPDQLRALRTRHVDELQSALRPADEAHVPRHVDSRAVGRGRIMPRNKRLRRIAAVDDPDPVRPRRDVRHAALQRNLPRRREAVRLAQQFRTKRIARQVVHAQRPLPAHVQQIARNVHAVSGTGRAARHLHGLPEHLSRAERHLAAGPRHRKPRQASGQNCHYRSHGKYSLIARPGARDRRRRYGPPFYIQ